MRTKLWLGAFCVIFTTSLHAQQNPLADYREIHISIGPFSGGDFGLHYKASLNENTAFRISLVHINSDFESTAANVSNTYPSSELTIHAGIEAGLEKRLAITDKMNAFYGINLVCQPGYSRNKYDSPNIPEELRVLNNNHISAGLGFNSGIILNIKNDFFLAAELVPQLLFEYNKSENRMGNEIITRKTKGFDFSLNSESVRISLIYRWGKG